MRTASPTLAGKFRDIADRVWAALREQREIEARQVLQRYRHLLAQPHETLPLNEIIPVRSKKDIPADANGSDARERAAGQPTFRRA